MCGIQHNHCTVEPPLTDTSRKYKRTLPISGHQTAVLAISSLKHYIFNPREWTPLVSGHGHIFEVRRV